MNNKQIRRSKTNDIIFPNCNPKSVTFSTYKHCKPDYREF